MGARRRSWASRVISSIDFSGSGGSAARLATARAGDRLPRDGARTRPMAARLGKGSTDVSPGAKPREASIVMMSGTPERHAQLLGDVVQARVVQAGKLDGRTLALRELGEAGLNHPAA